MHVLVNAWPVFCCSGCDTFTLLAVSLSLAVSLGLAVSLSLADSLGLTVRV